MVHLGDKVSKRTKNILLIYFFSPFSTSAVYWIFALC